MDTPLNHAALLQQRLRMKEPVFAALYGETGKFPFNNMRKPDERADIIEFDRPEAFLCVQNVKACVTELPARDVEILLRERQFSLSQKQLHQLAVSAPTCSVMKMPPSFNIR